MGKGIIDSSILTAIANAIRKLLGVNTDFYPEEMPEALNLTGTLTITENGTYDVKKYAKAVVKVSGGVVPDPEPEGCDHSTTRYSSNGNGTHNLVCADCGETLWNNQVCSFNGGICTLCGYACVHNRTHANPNGHHEHDIYCDVCGMNLSTEPCDNAGPMKTTLESHIWTCSVCGDTFRTEVHDGEPDGGTMMVGETEWDTAICSTCGTRYPYQEH